MYLLKEGGLFGGEGAFAVPIIHAGGGGKSETAADSATVSFSGISCLAAATDDKDGAGLEMVVVLFDGAVVL